MHFSKCFLFVVLSALFTRAERFDNFLQSLDQNFPINTKFMQGVLKSHSTKLANPSLLEKWGVINQEAAATYNSILNTVVLKEEYTIDEKNSEGKTKRRVKTILELQQQEPWVWTVRASTIFHELSHAEYSWLAKSTDAVDTTLVNFLNTEFEGYLKINHPNYSGLDRKIARSEMFAYFRGETIGQLFHAVDEIMLENGYYKSNGTCRTTNFILRYRAAHPNTDMSQFLLLGADKDFTQMTLPTIFVKGKDASLDSSHPTVQKLNTLLWAQFHKHYAVSSSKQAVVRWMNTQPTLLQLIKPCRTALP